MPSPDGLSGCRISGYVVEEYIPGDTSPPAFQTPRVRDRGGGRPRRRVAGRRPSGSRSSGQDPGDPDLDPPDELVPVLLGRSG